MSFNEKTVMWGISPLKPWNILFFFGRVTKIDQEMVRQFPSARLQAGTQPEGSWSGGSLRSKNMWVLHLPSGKHTKNYGKIHHFQWVNPL
jgi:hypothetical protein